MHGERSEGKYDRARQAAIERGEDSPYRKIDMTPFQEDWPPPWMN